MTWVLTTYHVLSHEAPVANTSRTAEYVPGHDRIGSCDKLLNMSMMAT